jgi:Uma2 family endonuclease
MATTEHLLTAEQYAQLPDNGVPTELERGRVVAMNVPSFRHGMLCGRIAKLLATYVDDRDLGYVLCNDAGMITERDPDTVRGPDVSFFSYSRIPKGADPEGYPDQAPEVVFEVRSPGDRWAKLLGRVSEFLSAGVLVVYVVEPKKKTVSSFDPEQAGRTLQDDDELTFPPPIEELRIPVRALFS